MITIPSQQPLSITEGGETKVYDQWGAPHVSLMAMPHDGTFRLILTFCRYAVGENEELVKAPVQSREFTCEDVLNDETLGPIAQEFFAKVVERAFQQGIIE